MIKGHRGFYLAGVPARVRVLLARAVTDRVAAVGRGGGPATTLAWSAPSVCGAGLLLAPTGDREQAFSSMPALYQLVYAPPSDPGGGRAPAAGWEQVVHRGPRWRSQAA